MAKPSRWSKWVISESANPGIQMPWVLTDRVRQKVGKAAQAAILTPSAAMPQALR